MSPESKVNFPPNGEEFYKIRIRPEQLKCCTLAEFRATREPIKIFCSGANKKDCAEQAGFDKCVRMDVYLGKSVTTSLPITHAQEISPTPLTRRPTPTKRTSDRPSGGRKSAALELREKQMQDFVDYFNPHVPGGYQAEKRSKGIGRLKQFIPKEVALTIAKGAFIVGMAATGVGAFEELSDYRPLSAKLDQQAMQSCNPVSQERMNAALAMVSSFKESTPSLVDKFEINVIRDVVNSPQVVAADNTLLDQLNFESCKRALYDQSGANTKQVIDLSLVLGGSLLATVGAFGTVLAGTSGEYRRFI